MRRPADAGSSTPKPPGLPFRRPTCDPPLFRSRTSRPSPALGAICSARCDDDRSLRYLTVKRSAWTAGDPTPFVALIVRS